MASLMRRHRYMGIFALVVLVVLAGGYHCSWALQRHTLMPEETVGGHAAPAGEVSQAPAGLQQHTTQAASETRADTAGHSPAPGQSEHGSPEAHATPVPSQNAPGPALQAHGAETHALPQAHEPSAGQEQQALPSLPPAHAPGEEEHAAAPAHGEGLAVHGPSLPEISPIPGVTFVETMIRLMEHELDGRFLGWRPNDIIIGRFTDNVNNYQLGVLEAMRFTTLRLKDSLTRMGDADSYDPDLEMALNLLMNRATLFWFPSAESSYREAVDHLKNFLAKLESKQRSFYYRSDNLLLLINTYKDLLGNVNRSLIRSPVSWFKTDDYFYYAKGVAHVYYEILRVVRVGFQSQLATTLDAVVIMDEALHELYIAEQLDPWLILDSDLDGFFANHRANLNAPLSEVAHLLVVLSHF